MTKQLRDAQPVSVYLDKKLLARFDRYCATFGAAKSKVLAMALEDFLDRKEKKGGR